MAEKGKEKEAKAEGFDPAYLKGLTFRDAETRKVKDEDTGKEKEIAVPRERPLKAEQVLAWKDYGDLVVIVAADGRKHRVEKKAA